MATTENFHNGTGGTEFQYTFPALLDSDVKASVDAGSGFVETTAFTLLTSPTRVKFNTAPASGTNNVRIFRDTNVDSAKAVFAAGSSIRAADLNNNMDQVLYSNQEKDRPVATEDIKDGAIVEAKLADNAVTQDKIANNAVGEDQIANNAVTGLKIAADQIGSQHIADDQINSEHIAAGAIDLEHMSSASVDSDNIVNASIVGGDIANNTIADANLVNQTITATKIANATITGTQIANDTINSQHYAAGSIDLEHMSANSVDSDQYVDGSIDLIHMSANSVGEDQYINGSVKGDHIGNDEVNSQHLAAGSIDTEHIGNDQLESQHYAAGSIDLEHLAANSVGEDQYVDGSVKAAHIGDSEINSQHYADGSIDHEHLANDIIDGDNIQDNAIGAEHLAANSVTTSEIADAELTTLAGMQSGTASILAGGTALTSTLTELNMLDGKSIVTTISSPTDVQLPTAQAVEERIVDLVTDVGGFVPIANETSFPTTNPDPADNAGTIVSIKALASNLTSNGSGVATIANGAGSGNTVTINGMANSDTIEAGKGILVETTSTLHTYTFHRETLAPADITTAKNAVDDFNERYRILASGTNINTVGSLDDGDLLWDSNVDKMKVYDATASAWKEVTSTGEFKFLYLCPDGGSGAPNLALTSFDLREGSNSGSVASITNAAQLLVSINGVIQKANTGTSAPAEGFAMADGNNIKFGSAPGVGSSIFIVQIGSAVSIPTPGDDTVSTVKIQNLAVTTGKIADQAVDLTKLPHGDGSSNGKFLRSNNGADPTWETVSTTPEGTAILSTGESGGTKFLREDGDGTSSWQTVVGAVADNCIYENSQTISNNYTIASGKGAHSVGPITVNNCTVTVNGNWVVS